MKNITKISPINLILILWLLTGIICILFVPVDSDDELHYLGVAWNMYKTHSWLLTYSMADVQRVDLEKTPLLYWFILGGWRLFGVNEIVPKTILFLFGTANLWLTYILAKQIFPENSRIAWVSLLALFCNFLWPRYFGANIRFEGLITFFGLLFLIFLIEYIRNQTMRTFLAASISLGLCLFSKGGVGFIYFLPLAILMPWLLNKDLNFRWILSLTAIIGIALILPALYLIYIYTALGYQKLHYLLFTQISKRVGLHFRFNELIGVIVCFSPLILLVRFKKLNLDKRLLILLVQIFFSILFFSIMVTIQAKRYLIPTYPLIALVLAYLIDQAQSHDRSLMVLAIIFSGVLIINNLIEPFGKTAKFKENLANLGKEVQSLQLNGYPVAQFTPYIRSQNLEFLGRLSKNLPIISDPKDQEQWLQQNPHGFIIEDCDKTSHHCFQLRKDSIKLSTWNDKKAIYCIGIMGNTFKTC